MRDEVCGYKPKNKMNFVFLQGLQYSNLPNPKNLQTVNERRN